LQNLAVFWTKNAKYFGENILKIKPSVPGGNPTTVSYHASVVKIYSVVNM
jgi:hypothetical protein